MRHSVPIQPDIRPFRRYTHIAISERSCFGLIRGRYAGALSTEIKVCRISVSNATVSPTLLLSSQVSCVVVTVWDHLPHVVAPSLSVVADAFGFHAQRSASTTLVSERAVSARKIKAPHTTPLNGPLLREEVCDLARVVGAECPAVAGFTAARFLNVSGAPRACAPLSASPVWTTDSTDIHLPPSRLLPRATPGCAGCAERGWRRTPLGLRPAASQLTFGAAERRPSPPGVARGQVAASTAAANIRARRGRRALVFAGLGPGSWPRRVAGAPRLRDGAERTSRRSERPLVRWGEPLASHSLGCASDRKRQVGRLASTRAWVRS